MKISLEQLAEKLNGKLWVKGEMKRIYLDEGYNTKKMSTKTYVYERQDGSFGVSCRIDCPSQNDNWITSQEDKIIAGVEKEIENIIKISTLELLEYKILEEKAECEVFVKVNAEAEPSWFAEEDFYEEFGSYPAEVFGGNLEVELEAIYEKMREAARKKEAEKIEHPNKVNTELAKENSTPAEKIKLGDGKKVSHNRFGLGEILEETEEKVKVLFEDHGERSLLKKYAPLTYINE